MADHAPIPDSGPPLQQVLVDVDDGGVCGIVYGPGPAFEVVGVWSGPERLPGEES